MQFQSTRGGGATDLITAVMRGLAPDGGLYVPDALPRFDVAAFDGRDSLAEIAEVFLAPFFADSPLAPQLGDICRDSLNFPVPLKRLAGADGLLSVLELFHGPTAAFKDVGARFLAAVTERTLPLVSDGDDRPVTILVATSGDTGGAVAAAFHRRRGVRVGVLYPKGQVSPRQQHQLTCWGDNVRSFEVEGSFDDCQAIVKAAFVDPELSRRHRLNAANSINLGRLLPQAAYHAAASLWHVREHGHSAGVIVPTGNLGNGLGAVWAKAMGLPLREVVLAVNANRSIPDYLATGQWQPRASVRTLASAMDVGSPSNMERLRHLMPGLDDVRAEVEAYPVDDDSIRLQIGKDFARFGEAWCPHTATGFHVYDHLPEARRRMPWVVCATAHPAKFESIVEPIIGRRVEVPPALAELLERPAESIPLEPRLEALAQALGDWG